MKYSKRQIHEYREQISGWELGRDCCNGNEVSFWDNEKALALDSSDDHTTL